MGDRAAWCLIALGLGLLVFSGQARAFDLPDHAAITKVAFQEALHCVPGMARVFPRVAQNAVVMGDLEEDLNIVRKWKKYSHYFNPFKKLDMRRYDSSRSILESEAALESADSSGLSAEDRYLLLGRAIHHIQDSAVPVHVVPVNHWLNDGFERYSLKLAPESDCGWARSPAPVDLMVLLEASATQTYLSLDESFTYRRAGVEVSGAWEPLFWIDGIGPKFGAYGELGNRFGQGVFELQGVRVEIDPMIYEKFKLARLRQAVDGTRMALLWYQALQE